jgi:hypothetical protein
VQKKHQLKAVAKKTAEETSSETWQNKMEFDLNLSILKLLN